MSITLIAQRTSWVLLLASITILGGCGGGSASESDAPSGPKVDTALYSALIEYCNLSVPSAVEAARDGWISESPHFGRDGFSYGGNGFVSASGSSVHWDEPLSLSVSFTDYRGVSDNAVLRSVGKPAWRNGVYIPTMMRPGSVGCITQTARIYTPPRYDLGLDLPQLTEQTPSLTWTSRWDKAVPVQRLPGYPVNGFEFVANFEPEDGRVFFQIPKARFNDPSSLAVCHLPAYAAQWACSQPLTADAGENWHMSSKGVKQGVYVLVSPFLH